MIRDEPRLIAQERGVWVLHKPAGYAVHRTGDASIPDLQRWAEAELDAPESLSPIHRLDRATSGVVRGEVSCRRGACAREERARDYGIGAGARLDE